MVLLLNAPFETAANITVQYIYVERMSMRTYDYGAGQLQLNSFRNQWTSEAMNCGPENKEVRRK